MQSDNNQLVVGLGELLWDLLPDGKQMGGAPANFAYHAACLGNDTRVVSRIGDDELGGEVLERFGALELDTQFLQSDPAHPTGTVPVEIDEGGQPDFTITEDVAWDYIRWTDELAGLAGTADAVCFGSLAQRCATSRETIQRFLEATRPACVRVFDVNLRQAFYTAEVLARSMESATIAKLNNDELPKVAALLDCNGAGENETARELIRTFRLALVCVTRGENGSLLVSADTFSEHPGVEVDVVDTVGSGDAFTAALVYYFLRGAELDAISEAANRLGAWVATRPGATPDPGVEDYPLS